MTRINIYYQEWEYACCGDEFHVGKHISWDVSSNYTFPEKFKANFKNLFISDFHSIDDASKKVNGTITSIHPVFAFYTKENHRNILQAYKLEMIDAIESSASNINKHASKGVFNGFMVEIDLEYTGI